MSTHKVEVVKIHPEKHPNADKLALVHVAGWQVVVGKDEYTDGDLAAFVPPEYVIPLDPPVPSVIAPEILVTLQKNCRVVDGQSANPDSLTYVHGYRIKVRKFRGEWSQGFLLPIPSGTGIPHNEGADVMAALGIGYYNPEPPASVSGECERGPDDLVVPKYDIENVLAYPDVFEPGEPTFAREKIDGTNCAMVWHGDRFWVRSRNLWRKESVSSVYWRALSRYSTIQAWLKAHPDVVLFGEVYGDSIGTNHYGRKNGDVAFAIFDVLENGNYWDPGELAHLQADGHPLPLAPLVTVQRFFLKDYQILAEHDTLVDGATGPMEGLVIRPQHERMHPKLGRVQLKLLSNQYLERQ